ncbi:hypothetical protein EW146_g9856 [Bondarzewia mesenterica]|uniref:Uncharacterized protein n=1 Tax=Bondarzewia mesenterica TaxID=1095465 RepID=A0A4S4L411_9AGAM|nr:hypothetical protein EW146_g9856 [Bondarzewia mesenterica]
MIFDSQSEDIRFEVTGSEEAKRFLERNLLVSVGSPLTITALCNVLLHISQLDRVPKPAVCAIQAVTIMLGQVEDDARVDKLVDVVADRFLSSLRPFARQMDKTATNLDADLGGLHSILDDLNVIKTLKAEFHASQDELLSRSKEQAEQIYDDDRKAKTLAAAFFPPSPTTISIDPDYDYPDPVCGLQNISRELIITHAHRISPYKAPGPDGIPNDVLTWCIDSIAEHLYWIYRATFSLQMYYDPWHSFITVVLRKPGKPRYDIAKSYRPIALLNTMAKLLTSIILEQLIYIDIEGAFPNAVTARLLHNMRSKGVLEAYVLFVEHMLMDRCTTLQFDDYESQFMEVTNGIGQGDPLSMVLYLFYNADILKIPKTVGRSWSKEDALSYVDDTALIVVGKSFEETHRILADMMTRTGGALDWSQTHNSRFEPTKFALVDFTQKKEPDPNKRGSLHPLVRPSLHIPGLITIQPTASTRYLGVIIDQELRWQAQAHSAVGKGMAWTSQLKRLAKPSTGIKPALLRQLYAGVAIPKMMYAADVWCTPIYETEDGKKARGSVEMATVLTRVQRTAARTILGGLSSSPIDALEVHTNLLPIELLIDKLCQRAATRLASLPKAHPLHDHVQRAARTFVK